MSTELLAQITNSLVDGDPDATVAGTKQAIAAGLEPLAIIEGGLVPGMRIVGDKYASGEYFLPNLIVSASGMKQAMALLAPELKARRQELKSAGTVVIGTVRGDIHEIGKSLVATMLAANGFEVHDLGVDVSVDAFVSRVRDAGANLVGLSALADDDDARAEGRHRRPRQGRAARAGEGDGGRRAGDEEVGRRHRRGRLGPGRGRRGRPRVAAGGSGIVPIDVAIVGGGAAGLTTAIMAARRLPGARVVVFDGASRLGAKILVSGGGRCNVTNRAVAAADYWGGDRRFIDSVLRAFSAADTVTFFEGLGVGLHEEEHGKLFPDSGRSRTVLDALVEAARQSRVDIRLGRRVEAVRRAAERCVGSSAWRTRPRSLGGWCSPPAACRSRRAGAMEAAWRWRRPWGTASCRPRRPSRRWCWPARSTARSPVCRTKRRCRSPSTGRRPVRLRGSLLWTHFGVSGPLALDASRHWHRAALEGGRVSVRLSFVPDLDFAGCRARPARRGRRAAVGHSARRTRGAPAGRCGRRSPRVARDRLRRPPGAPVAGGSPASWRGALVSWELPVTGQSRLQLRRSHGRRRRARRGRPRDDGVEAV